MLREFAPGEVWLAEMPFGRLGFHVGARMTIVRLPSGELWVHSPIALTPELRQAVEPLGRVRSLIVPSKMHTAHLAEWADAYPQATVHAVAGARDTLGRTPRPELLGDAPHASWGDVIDQSILRGSAIYDEADFLHRSSRTLILTDLCFHVPEDSGASTRLWANALGVLGRLSSSRSFVLTMKDRAAARASIERILEWDFDRVVISHGQVTERDGKRQFHQAFAWLLR